MQPIDLLIEPRWLLTMEGAGAVLEDNAVAVDAGRIVAIGPRSALRQRYDARRLESRPQHALLPGFVNAHTHAAMSLLRGQPVRGPVQRWLRELIWPLENRWVSADFVRTGTRLAIAEQLRAGITCFADMYLYPEEVAATARELKLRIAVGLPIAEGRSAWAQNADDYLEKSATLWDEFRGDPWARMYFAPHAPYSVGDDTIARLRRLLDQLDAPFAMHLHETQSEIQDCLALRGLRPVAWLAEQGLLRPGFTAVHMNHADERDIESIAAAGVCIAACPQSNLRLGSGVAPLGAFAAAGIHLALGTDGPASTGALDLLAEARLAALLGGGARTGVTPNSDEVLRMATLGGAQVLGLAEEIGSLRVGKAADLCCLRLPAHLAPARHTLADTLLFDCSRQDIQDVWVAGRAVLTQGVVSAFDEQQALERARVWQARLATGLAA